MNKFRNREINKFLNRLVNKWQVLIPVSAVGLVQAIPTIWKSTGIFDALGTTVSFMELKPFTGTGAKHTATGIEIRKSVMGFSAQQAAIPLTVKRSSIVNL